MGARRFASLGVTWLCLMVGVVSYCAVSAQATEVHGFAGSFGSKGSASGQFDHPLGVAVNDTTGDVYVADSANNRVQELTFSAGVWTVIGEFDGAGAPTGIFSDPTQIAVDNSNSPLDPSAGDVYVVDSGHDVVDKFSPDGVSEGQLTGTPSSAFEHENIQEDKIQGVAVDSNGVVWVIQNIRFEFKGRPQSDGFIDSFSDGSTNEYQSAHTTTFGGLDEGFAVDSADDFYIATVSGTFVKLNSFFETLNRPFSGDSEAYSAAVDSVGQEVYLDNNQSIEAFSLDGAPIESGESGALAPSFGSGRFIDSKGVAVDSSDGTVYATDESADDVVAFEVTTVPTVAMGPVSDRAPRGLTLNGTVAPEGTPIGSCVFEYGTTSAYGQSVPCSPDAGGLGAGSSPVAVSAHVTGLLPGVTYHYRLFAENTLHASSATSDRELVAGPGLGGESVVDLTSDSATLEAPLDPNGVDTHYYFQYGLTTAYGSYAPVSPPGVDLGAGVVSEPVSAHLQGLQAGTVYHYRLVVVQDGEVFEEPDGSFMTQSVSTGSVLPDGRAWELVSPANKKGALIEFFGGIGDHIQAASDGSGITYLTSGPHVGEGAEGKIKWSQVVSRRGPDGWESEDLTIPANLPEGGAPAAVSAIQSPEYKLFSPGLSSAVVEPQLFETAPLGPGATEPTLYLRNNENKSFVPLVTPANVPAGTRIDEPYIAGGKAGGGEWNLHFMAATPDFRHIILKTPMALTPAEGLSPAATDEETELNRTSTSVNEIQWNLYEWNEGKLQLVNVLPNGEATHAPAEPGVRLAGSGGHEGELAGGDSERAISSDGRRIAWTLGEKIEQNESSGSKADLYVRDMVEEKTVQVGGPEAVFQGMNSEGSKVFYLEKGDLYVFEYGTGTETDLTANHGPGEDTAGVQEAVSDISEDGSYVYFVAHGVLTKGSVAGENNLYLLHDTGSDWQTTHVATLSPEDEHTWYAQADRYPALSRISSRVSPDGQYLTFMSSRQLTGYDNLDAKSGVPDQEVYLYDAVTGRLTCVSCNPTGARPVGVLDIYFNGQEGLLVDGTHAWAGSQDGREKAKAQWLAGSIPSWEEDDAQSTNYQPQYLDDNGRVFFDSPDALVPQATNGLEDVYEYEPAGVGSCVVGSVTFSERSDGCVSLISSGTSSTESAFYDASEDGGDVFFITKAKLVSEDYDAGSDVYDAHVCSTAVPCAPVPVSAPPCDSGDSCKAAPSPQPEIFGPAPSATFNGIGNVIASLSVSVVKTKSLTNAQKLARALKACHKEKGKRRGACEARMRKRYPLKRVSKTVKASGKGGR
jgi:DNA-binding beta-propeller fold protein YncE